MRYFLLAEDKRKVFKNILKNGNLSYFLENRGSRSRTSDNKRANGHFVCSTTVYNEYFFQIEFADCLTDEKAVYLIKKMYVGGGKGALKKYYNDYSKKFGIKDINKPFDDLALVLDADVIEYEGNSWITICKIDLNKMLDDEYKNETLQSILNDVCKCIFEMENILNFENEEVIKNIETKKALRQILSSEDKKRIELAAME